MSNSSVIDRLFERVSKDVLIMNNLRRELEFSSTWYSLRQEMIEISERYAWMLPPQFQTHFNVDTLASDADAFLRLSVPRIRRYVSKIQNYYETLKTQFPNAIDDDDMIALGLASPVTSVYRAASSLSASLDEILEHYPMLQGTLQDDRDTLRALDSLDKDYWKIRRVMNPDYPVMENAVVRGRDTLNPALYDFAVTRTSPFSATFDPNASYTGNNPDLLIANRACEVTGVIRSGDVAQTIDIAGGGFISSVVETQGGHRIIRFSASLNSGTTIVTSSPQAAVAMEASIEVISSIAFDDVGHFLTVAGNSIPIQPTTTVRDLLNGGMVNAQYLWKDHDVERTLKILLAREVAVQNRTGSAPLVRKLNSVLNPIRGGIANDFFVNNVTTNALVMHLFSPEFWCATGLQKFAGPALTVVQKHALYGAFVAYVATRVNAGSLDSDLMNVL